VIFKIRHHVPKTLDYFCEGSIVLYFLLVLLNACVTYPVSKEEKVFGIIQLFNYYYFSVPCICLLICENTKTKVFIRLLTAVMLITLVSLTETILFLPLKQILLALFIIQTWVEMMTHYYSQSLDRLITQQVKLE